MQEFLTYWGKAQPDQKDGPAFHPLAWHMLDVAAVADRLLLVRPHAIGSIARRTGMDMSSLQRLIVFLAAVHDTGKFARAFQAKVPAIWREAGHAPAFDPSRPHDVDGWAFWSRFSGDDPRMKRIWGGERRTFLTLLGASVAHHGRPVRQIDDESDLHRDFGEGLHHAAHCIDALTLLILKSPIENVRSLDSEARRISHWIAGLVTVADWIGSNTAWFPYRLADISIEEYWAGARRAAQIAVEAAGVTPTRPSDLKSFGALTGQHKPTPLQHWATSVDLPGGPLLIIVEDATGSGKTEAAQMLTHRLLSSGRAAGAYWAMPTQATANAMFERQATMLSALFAERENPSIVLAHGEAALRRLLSAAASDAADGEAPDAADVTASSSCAAFIGDDRRLAFLADIGAGTVDQALLSVLPSRFNTVRLYGLSDKVLIIDEAHAYDAYVTEELHTLLQFHAAQGGVAIVLSATLPLAVRTKLIEAWRRAAGRNAPIKLGSTSIVPQHRQASDYPSALIASADTVTAIALATAPEGVRTLPVEPTPEIALVLDQLAKTLAAGGCAAWIRNTVDDVLAAADMARALGLSPVIFHARFAQCDRQTIERAIIRQFGRNSTAATRAGGLVIATQVIEQSLDIDFDQLATDLSPIDSIIQRAGRMRRHQRSDRPTGAGASLILHSPDPQGDIAENWLASFSRGTSYVYSDSGVMWRTARELFRRGEIRSPDDIRPLIEAVYDGADCPDALLKSDLKAEGARKARAAAARSSLLQIDHGYDSRGQAWIDERKVSTRDSDAMTTLRLATIGASGVLEPWARSTLPLNVRWALSEVKMRSNKIPPDAKTSDEYSDAAQMAKASWGRWEQDIPIAVLRDRTPTHFDGRLTVASSTLLSLSYSTLFGLVISKSDC